DLFPDLFPKRSSRTRLLTPLRSTSAATLALLSSLKMTKKACTIENIQKPSGRRQGKCRVHGMPRTSFGPKRFATANGSRFQIAVASLNFGLSPLRVLNGHPSAGQ